MFSTLSIERASHAESASVQYVGIDHGRGHVAVAEQFLYGPNVLAGVEQVSRERVSEVWHVAGTGIPARRTASLTARCKTDS